MTISGEQDYSRAVKHENSQVTVKTWDYNLLISAS